VVHEVAGCRYIEPVKGAFDAGVDICIESGADFSWCESADPLHRNRGEVDLDGVVRQGDVAGDGLRRGTGGIPVSPVLSGTGETEGQGREPSNAAKYVGVHF